MPQAPPLRDVGSSRQIDGVESNLSQQPWLGGGGAFSKAQRSTSRHRGFK